MKRILTIKISLAIGFLALSACSPKIQERQFDAPKTEFKPNYEDVDLRAQYKDAEELKFQGDLEFSGTYGNGSLYRFSENLFILGKDLNRPALTELGDKTRESLQVKSKNRISAEKTTYVDYLIAKSKDPVKDALAKLDQDIKTDQDNVVAMINTFNEKFTSGQAPPDIKSGIAYIKKYLRDLNRQISSKELMPDLKAGLQAELKVQLEHLDVLEAQIDNVLMEGITFPVMLSRLFEVLKNEKIDLPEDVAPMIEQAKTLSAGLESCTTPQEAMTVIIDVWLLLDEEDRKTYFEEISPELYAELAKAGKKTIACLRDEECSGFFRKLKKNLFVLPAIKKFGPEKICKEIDLNAQVFVKDLLQTEITKVIISMPGQVPAKVKEAIDAKRNDLKAISGNYNSFFREHFSKWASSKNIETVSLLPDGRKDVDLSGEQLRFDESKSESRVDMLEAMGPALAAATAKTNLKNAYEMLNRMTRVSEIIMSDKAMNGQPISKEFRNGYQAEMVRGLSQLVRYFRDWESSDFDSTLGTVMAQDLLGDEVDLGEMNRALFPKADLYALSVATAAQFLGNFQSQLSPIVSVDFEDNFKFLDRDEKKDKDLEEACQETPGSGAYDGALAGIVEIKDGKRQTVVNTTHMARWIIALAEFYNSLEGAEKSSSIDLVTPDKCGNKPIDKITQSRKTILQLIAGLTNFLSRKLINEEGMFVAEYNLVTKKASGKLSISVLDQALGMRALLASSEILGIDSYRFAAVDAYYKMNQNLFHKKQRFYKNAGSEASLQLPVVMEVLRALQALQPSLPTKSAEQLNWIMEPWLSGLENIKF